MAGTQRKIRKVQTSKVADFDDQLWPINVAILILAGFVAGVVIATSDFNDPRILYNGWARLASVGLMVVLLFWGVMMLQGRMMRRLQLCILISLLVHLWLAIYLHDQFLALLAEREARSRSRVVERYEEITVPDYNWQQVDRSEQRQTFEEPTEHEAPEPREPEAIRRTAEEPELPTEQELVEEPEVPQRQQPNPAVVQRAELSAPRRADAAAGAQISRQEWKHRPKANEPIPEPQLKPQPRQTAAGVPEVKISPRRRQQQLRVKVNQRQTFEELASVEQPLEVQMARRATRPEKIPDVPTTPSPSRHISRPAEIPRTEAAAEEPIKVVERPRPVQPAPRPMAARRQAETPRLVRQTAEAAPATTPRQVVPAAAGRHRAAEQTPQLARAPRAVPSRRPRRVAIPSDAAKPQSQPVAVAKADVAQLDPASLKLPRPARSVTAPPSLSVSQQSASVPAQAGPSTVARSSTRRTVRPTEPTSTPRAARPARISQPREVPQLASARIAPAVVAVGPASPAEATLPVTRPSRSTVSRAADGPAAVSQNQAPGRELPAMTSAVQLPSAMAARRSTVSQQAQPGAAQTPARPMTLARSNTGTNIPSSAVAVETAPAVTPAAPGSTTASRMPNAGRSVAVRQSGASPPSGKQTAAAGATEIGLGTTQVIARSGQPRSSGLGRPSAAANAPTPRIARVAGPPASIASSGAVEAAPVAPGAVASTASGPSRPAFNIRTSAARQGGTVRPFAVEAISGSGPDGSSGTPGPVGLAQPVRVTRVESIASAIAGGGTPKPGRTTGGAVSPNVRAEAAAVAVATAAGGKANQAPQLQAQTSGPRRQVAGLPGSLQSQPSVGALASLTSEGAAVTEAVARRSTASGSQPGATDVAAARTVTLTRSRVGTELPSAAAPVERIPEAGLGGVAVAAPGALPSTLEVGPSATVRRAAADVGVAQATLPAGVSQPAAGSAPAVAMAGKARAVAEDVPAAAVAQRAPEVGRSTVGPSAAAAGPAEAQPAAEAISGGPTAEAGTTTSPIGTVATTAVATTAVATTAGAPAAVPAEAAGALAGPEGEAVAVARLSRVSRSDSMPALASAGAVAGPRRTMGTLQASGTSTLAPEMAQPGPAAGGVEAGPNVVVQASFNASQQPASGLPGRLIDRTPVETATQAGPASTTPGMAAGHRRLPQGNQPGPSLAAPVGRGPLKRTDVAGLPTGVSQAIAEEPVAVAAAAEPGDAIEAVEGVGVGEPSRQEGGLPVQIVAMAGPGGLGYDPSPEVGLPSRRARPESEIIHTVSRRFVIERSGGELAIDGRVREQPAKAFRQRDVGRRAQVARQYGGTEGTEKAVEMGLDFFARHQFPDGHWSLHELPGNLRYPDPALGQMRSDSAATGLVLLTYLGAGYTHLDDKHRAIVDRGIDWLVRNQQPDGDLFSKVGGSKYTWLYSHGIAAIALCEAYGMTQDPELREPARKAVDFIVSTQHPTRGGWRYKPFKPDQETDTSVSGWQLMALKSAQMAGLDVPQKAFDRVDAWLDQAAVPNQEGRYVYNPYAADTPEQREGRKPNLAMTAEAMLMRMYLGHQSNEPNLIAGADYLKENLPAVESKGRPARDCYYWYYATQAMFQMQRDYWPAWNDRLREISESSQVEEGETAGSWHPHKPVQDRWGHAGGRLYVTAMHLLMLEVYYRHLPLFQELSK